MTSGNDPVSTFLHALRVVLDEAVSGGLLVRLVLKGGEVLEGVPLSVSGGASNRPPAGWNPPEHQRHLYAERMEITVEIAGTEILLEEVASFTLTLSPPTGGGV